MTHPASALTGLECARCARSADPGHLNTFCDCGGTLLARYDLEKARTTLTESVSERESGIWRWAEILPVEDPEKRRGLGEGDTALVRAENLEDFVDLPNLLLKDEGTNPGGSFKARGMAVAVARAVELGATEFALASAGNAGGAAAAYGALWETPVHVALPRDTPEGFRKEIRGHGARVYDVEGDISIAGKWLAKREEARDWFFLSTLKEPFRVEGKKTMGLELVEQMGWRWPDVVMYPTGGGTGILGMAKADEELRELGLLSGPPPRFVVVQAVGCAPLVHAFEAGMDHADPWKDPRTYANGLRVPGTLGDHLILDTLRETGGTAFAVDDGAMEEARYLLGEREGRLAAPESAATLAAARALAVRGWIRPEETVVLFLTGNGFKYPRDPSHA